MPRCGCAGNCRCTIEPGDGATVTGTGSAGDPYIVGAAPSGTYVPAATSFTTEEMPDPIGGGTMTVIVFPADQAALAIKVEGDDFPRFLMSSDPGDGWYFGDGTVDPYASGVNIGCTDVDFFVYPPAGGRSTFNRDVRVDNGGVVLVAPDASEHRLKVSNAGVLSTEVV